MKVPTRCMRNGKPCAYRTRFAGGYGETMCGFLYYTDEMRGSVKDGVYIEADISKCDKWTARMPKGVAKDGERDADEDFSDCADSVEYSSCDNVLLPEGR